jgi:quinol monooxygenase YgiN
MRLFPAPSKRVHLLEILRSVRDLTIVRPGCLGCWLYEEDSYQRQVRYGEQWASDDELRGHIRSDLYRRVLAAIELSSRRPEVNFYYATVSKGMDLIEEVRGRSHSDANAG